jgi:hypothetical protein
MNVIYYLLAIVVGFALGVFRDQVGAFLGNVLFCVLYPFLTIILTPYFFFRHLFVPVHHIPLQAKHIFKNVYFCHYPNERRLHFKNRLLRYR